MPKLTSGQVVRVIGQPLARTRLQAFSVREADTSELQKTRPLPEQPVPQCNEQDAK